MTQSPQSFTGRKRRQTNRLLVRATDAVVRWFITISGIGTIVAVLLVFAFLLSVVVPLFWPSASLVAQAPVSLPTLSSPRCVAVSEYRTLGWGLDSRGTLRVFRFDTGANLIDQPLWEGSEATAIFLDAGSGQLVVGFDDGKVRMGRVTFSTTFREPSELPEELRVLNPGEIRPHEGGVVECTPQGQLRCQSVEAQLSEPMELMNRPLVALDLLSSQDEAGLGSRGPTIAAASRDGRLVVATTKVNPVTGEPRVDERLELPESIAESPTPPLKLLLTARGDNVWVAFRDGRVVRVAIGDPSAVRVVDEVRVVNEASAQLTSCAWALGRETMLCGDSTGTLSAWFRVRQVDDRPRTGDRGDGFRLRRVHELGSGSAAVTALASSPRSRLAAAGFEDGSIRLLHITTERQLVATSTQALQPIDQLTISPKEDALIALSESVCAPYLLDPRHPEVSFSSLFRPVWYEGYPQPAHVWQSSFAGVEPEMKLGLWPLVFGTLKATFYSLLFGAPLALLAAIHTSEFLSPKVRAQVKPAIEMMAGLPSVVLGFLAALVLAPWVERSVAVVLACFLTVPLAVSCGATLWQLLPTRWIPHWSRWRFAFIMLAIACGVVAGTSISGWIEQRLFGGSLNRWLDHRSGSGAAGWLLLFLPAAAVAVALAVSGTVNPWMRNRFGDWPRPKFALLNCLKLPVAVAVAVGLAYGASILLESAGWDPRGRIVDTYVQRNALVVGFVMGFAIIPLIYTLADDALTAVPQHLRAASLGAGATPWQTAVRIVIPTAMSGLFSALMIGLGRAVGETMIVLMAGGNTPVTDWNPFNGFRTLSANIAVELPEAVRGSTHYRTLYLAALTLFVLTFVVNTAAELVRMRFRKRATAL